MYQYFLNLSFDSSKDYILLSELVDNHNKISCIIPNIHYANLNASYNNQTIHQPVP